MSDTNDQDLMMTFSQSDRARYKEHLSTAGEKLTTAQASIDSNDSTLQVTKNIHDLYAAVKRVAGEVGDFWYNNTFKSYQRLTNVLTEFADAENIMSITVSEPNTVVGADGLEGHIDGLSNKTVVIGADTGNSLDYMVQDLFNRAKLQGMPVSQLDCTRLDGSVVTLTITITFDESVGYYTGLVVEGAGTSVDGLSHTVYSLIELAEMFGVEMDINRLEDKAYMRLVSLTIRDMAKVDRSIRHLQLTTQAKYCLVERQ